MLNKNAFQSDAYRPLVDHIPACTGQGAMYPSMHWVGGVYQVGGCLFPGGCLVLGDGAWSQGGVCPGDVADTPAGPEADTPLPVDRQTPVKT